MVSKAAAEDTFNIGIKHIGCNIIGEMHPVFLKDQYNRAAPGTKKGSWERVWDKKVGME